MLDLWFTGSFEAIKRELASQALSCERIDWKAFIIACGVLQDESILQRERL
jgi:hypothetical protein